ncbi:unnamed protein product, partial [Rotaria magnacalcarata]
MEYAEPVSIIASINVLLTLSLTISGVDGFCLLTETVPSVAVSVNGLNDVDNIF